MLPHGTPRILVCAASPDPLDELRRQLTPAGGHVGSHLFDSLALADLDTYHLIVLEGSRRAEALDLCRRFRASLNDSFVPILYITDDASPDARLASFEAGADTYLLRPFAA